MSDSNILETLLARETRNALGLAAMGGRSASKVAERIVHVAGATEPENTNSLRSSAMRLRIMASECLEAALTIAAEAARLELVAALRVGLAPNEPTE